MAEPLVYCVRCHQMVRADKTGEGQHVRSATDGSTTYVPCK